jgi:DNA-binding transcriptional LysR family regulator
VSSRAASTAPASSASPDTHIAFEASSPPLLAQLAARGLGVAILARSVIDGDPSGLHAVAISRPPMRGRLALAWRKQGSISPAARALVDHARERFGG